VAAETTVEFRVRYAETDQMGVVYHANFLIWCEIGRTDFLRQRGQRYADLERDGVALAVTEATVRFRAPARYDDLIRVRTRLREVRSRAVSFDYVIDAPERATVLAEAFTVLVAMTRDAKPVVLPDALRAVLGDA
jgi:acyl-CoA thioester hydrolase